MRHIAICDLPQSTKLYTLSHKRHGFWKIVIVHKMCVPSFFKNLTEIFFILRKLSEIWQKMHIGLHANYSIFLYDFNETWISRHIFGTHSDIKFHENPSISGRAIPFGLTGRYYESNRPFRTFVNAPKNAWSCTTRPPPPFVTYCLIQHKDSILLFLMHVA